MKRFIRQLSRIFKKEPTDIEYGDIEEYDGPLFDIGERVLVLNPNLTDLPEEPPETGVIYEIVYLPEIDQYAYKLEGSSQYYNENWLQADIYGPKHFYVMVANPSAEKVESSDKIDTMLEIYEWNKRMWVRTGDDSYLEKLKMLTEELEKLTG